MRPGALLAIAALAACEPTAAPPPSRQWTLFDLDRALRDDTNARVLVGAEVSDAAAAANYTSSDQILADKLVLHEGPGQLVALAPKGTRVEPLSAMRSWLTDLAKDIPGPMIRDKDYLDGQEVTSIDFGVN